jgi:hypothetical protein
MIHKNNYYTNDQGKELSVEAHEGSGILRICMRPSEKRSTIIHIDTAEWTTEDLAAFVEDLRQCLQMLCGCYEYEYETEEESG